MRLSIPQKYKPIAHVAVGTVIGIALYHLIRHYIPLGPFGYADQTKKFDITSSKSLDNVIKNLGSKLPGRQGTIDATQSPTGRKGVERYDITATPTHDQDIHPVPATTHHRSTPEYIPYYAGGGGVDYCTQCMMRCNPQMMGGGPGWDY